MPDDLNTIRHTSEHDPYEDSSDHGGRGGKASVCGEAECGKGHAAYLGMHLPWVRPDWILYGKVVFVSFITRRCGNEEEKEERGILLSQSV